MTSGGLFDQEEEDIASREAYSGKECPLAERMRPRTLDEYVGQRHLVGPGAPLRRLVERETLPSCILYGPPGVGKTTLVRLLAAAVRREIFEINAVSARVAELRDLVERARQHKRAGDGRSVVAFVDEIYHFNKQQQNALLPSVEVGDLILIGTTTENPFFEINKTLLSRMVVFDLKPLEERELVRLLRVALEDRERGLGDLEVLVSEDTLSALARGAGGDARQALLRLETAVSAVAGRGGGTLSLEALEEILPRAALRFDRSGDDHYAVISALIKSIRGSDPDAAVYWLARLVAAGEDVRFVSRRLVISAAEDVGLADPRALMVATAAATAADLTGWPEAGILLAEAVLYLAAAPKSNSSCRAIGAALSAVEGGDLQPVPEHLRPSGTGYRYPHDDPRHWVPQRYMESIERFYVPGILGEERAMVQHLARFWRRFQDLA